MAKRNPNLRNAAAKGFTLLELLLGMSLLLVVTGAVFEQINQMQKKSGSEAIKVDLSQEGREFVDQTVRDLHMSGYPSVSMYTSADTTSQMVAAGLARVSPTEILFEGDVNNDGSVYSVDIQYVANDPNNPNCPCVKRSVVPKAQGSPLNQGTSPTPLEINHVFPPGTGPGQSGEDLFAFYDQNGGVVPIGASTDISTTAGISTMASIKTVKINLSLLNTQIDPTNHAVDRSSISAIARVNR